MEIDKLRNNIGVSAGIEVIVLMVTIVVSFYYDGDLFIYLLGSSIFQYVGVYYAISASKSNERKKILFDSYTVLSCLIVEFGVLIGIIVSEYNGGEDFKIAVCIIVWIIIVCNCASYEYLCKLSNHPDIVGDVIDATNNNEEGRSMIRIITPDGQTISGRHYPSNQQPQITLSTQNNSNAVMKPVDEYTIIFESTKDEIYSYY